MKISGIGNNFSKATAQVQQAASKAFDQAISGKAMDIVGDAFQKEGSVAKFPIVFAEVTAASLVGLKDFTVNFVKNMLK